MKGVAVRALVRAQRHWRRVEGVLEGALDLEPVARDEYLERTCIGDASLRAEVEALLRSCHDARDFLATPGPKFAAPLLALDERPRP